MDLLDDNSQALYDHFDPGPEPAYEDDFPDPDIEMTIEEDEPEVTEVDCMEHDLVSHVEKDRIVIAIDFGTTFSSVAYTVLPKGVLPDQINVRQVKCIGNYPDYEPPFGIPDLRQDVPTELWYDDDHLGSRRGRRSYAVDHDQCGGSAEEYVSSSDDDFTDSEQSQSEDNTNEEADRATQNDSIHLLGTMQYWGFGVQKKLDMAHITRDNARPLTRFKLLLDQKEETDEVRSDLKAILRSLKRRRIINSETDIYAHYLTHLLKHTKEQLHLSKELHQEMLVQFVLCVPAKWPVNGCRIMQAALEVAVKESGMGDQANSSIHDMFMISEPEAAAECILAEGRSELFVGTAFFSIGYTLT